ncbi:MAG: putative methyltransferase [Acidimicrobiales bacterium]|nr:putative methyltransferase [Acidimicrobiales bacterium]
MVETVRERSYEVPGDLRVAWESEAQRWAAWARTPGHDSYWRFHRDSFLRLLPEPRGLTVDIGCGEGRLGRDLVARGYGVVGVDGSPTLASLAAEHDARTPTVVADAALLPLRDRVADLAIAFMSLQDIDDIGAALAESARILRNGGRLCLAIVHPMNSAGAFKGEDADAPFVVQAPYFEVRTYVDHIERAGLACTFASVHRTIEVFSRALEAAGFLIEALREVTEPDPADRWHRMPMFLHVRAVLP